MKEDCKQCRQCEDGMGMIPYATHEMLLFQAHRQERRLLIGLALALAVLVLSNAAWVARVWNPARTQGETVTEAVS